ncbi:hypothetical protein KR96_10030 [Ralstonia solanacearum]|nr:hypothetical protein KR96_10030 [Ralstonia solanacearum]
MGNGYFSNDDAAVRGRVAAERLSQPLHERIVALSRYDEPYPLQKQTSTNLRSWRGRVNSPDRTSCIILGRKASDVNFPIVLEFFREVVVEVPVCQWDEELLLETDKEILDSLECGQPSPGTRVAFDTEEPALLNVRHLKHGIRRQSDARDSVVREPSRKDDFSGRYWSPRWGVR